MRTPAGPAGRKRRLDRGVCAGAGGGANVTRGVRLFPPAPRLQRPRRRAPPTPTPTRGARTPRLLREVPGSSRPRMSQGAMPQPEGWPGAGRPDPPALEPERAPPGRGQAATARDPAGPGGPRTSAATPLDAEHEEDMYRAADEIEKEKELLIHDRESSEHKLSVAPEMDIMDYCKKEWRGNTQKAKCMKKGYEEVSKKFTSIRRVRGDNYCALRATLFQAMSQATELPTWLQDQDIVKLPEKLISRYSWIKHWELGLKLAGKGEDLSDKIQESLALLRRKWASLAEMKITEDKQAACDELFGNEEEEYSLYEAVKFLMLNTAIELYDHKENGKEVPFFSVLLFARDTSSDPGQLLRNHLNQVGRTGGLEQVEMFLLAYAVCHTIQVYRLSKYNTEEFITLYPTEPQQGWPMVTLIAEDDRHYNIPVRVCEETSL
ncbi:ubiquitin thioesterase otulin [Tachyglossus aculeatus]|uniref:ubiquitin thioesterase otulin n=1 Tax=Tachyglossus aculeatus TaxID=9261 RepID=UPI0018F30533|nr:ubiquitin thioesterase otulin [Tachyglossus aculeatus]